MAVLKSNWLYTLQKLSFSPWFPFVFSVLSGVSVVALYMLGTLDGYDLELTAAVSSAVSVPVIASGGAGNLDHLYQALTVGKADATLVASIFHYGQHTVREAKEYLASRGIAIRLPGS